MATVKGWLGCGNSKQEVNLGIALNERIPELLRVNFFKHNYPAFQNVRNIFKGCVIHIFASLLFMSKREHL